MGERERLYQGILMEPDEDAPRLVYADWLQENGTPEDEDRAAFIRVQIERTRLPEEDDRQAELRRREDDLLKKHAVAWRSEVIDGVAVGSYTRGFPSSIGPPTRNWPDWFLPPLEAMSSALARHPIVGFSAYHLRGGQAGLDGLASWPGLAGLRYVRLGHGGRPHFAQTEHLPGVLALAESPYAGTLQHLRLASTGFTGRGLLALAESPRLPALSGLDITGNVGATPADFEALAGTVLAVRLRKFACIGCQVTPEALRPLLDAAPLEDLEAEIRDFTQWLGTAARKTLLSVTIELRGPADLEDRAAENYEVEPVEGLLEWLVDLSLRRLCLEGADLGDAGLRELCGSHLATSLTTLRLRRCNLTPVCLPALRRLLEMGKIRSLDLSSNLFDAASIAEMVRWPELSGLHELYLDFNPLDEADLDVFDESPHVHPFLYLSC